MRARRLIPFGSCALAIALAVGLYAAIDKPESAHSVGSFAPAQQEAAVTPTVRQAVSAAGGQGAPFSADADIVHLFTPADRNLPAFFAVATLDGSNCVVTSSGVVAGCLSRAMPGTVTIADDSEADTAPPFVYGLVRSNVKTVVIEVGDKTHAAALGNGFYLFKLPGLAPTVDDVRSVTFTLAGGRKVRQAIGG